MITLSVAAAFLVTIGEAQNTPSTTAPEPLPPISADRRVGETQVTYLFGSVLPREAEWRPLTDQQYWQIYWKNTWANPGVIFRALGSAAGDHLGNEPWGWGQGWDAYAQRVGSRFATFAIQDTVSNLTAHALGYDVRYLRCKCDGFAKRAGYAVAQTFVTKNREGKWRPNIPQWTGALVGTSVAVYGWYPEPNRNINKVWQAGASQLIFPSIFNVLVEYGPELRRLIPFGKKP